MAKSSFNISPGLLVIFAVGYLGYQLLHKAIGSGDSDDEDAPKKHYTVQATNAEPVDDDPVITKKMMSGSEKDVLVVRTHGQEYVRIDDMVFCWRGSNLMGVFNQNGLVPGWQSFTNQPPTK